MGFRTSADAINQRFGIGARNYQLEAQNNDFRFLEERSDYKRAVGKHLKKKTIVTPSLIDKNVGVKPNQTLEAMGNYYRALEGASARTTVNNIFLSGAESSEKVILANVNDITENLVVNNKTNITELTEFFAVNNGGNKNIMVIRELDGKDVNLDNIDKLLKRNNFRMLGLIALGGLAAWGIKELVEHVKEKKNAKEAEPVAEQPVVEEKAEEVVTPNLPLNEDGTYTSVEGDNFNTIAARYLADKYRNEPDKFENLSEAEKEAMIDKECVRIMKLNGYEFDENRFNSKPPLYVPDNVKII